VLDIFLFLLLGARTVGSGETMIHIGRGMRGWPRASARRLWRLASSRRGGVRNSYMPARHLGGERRTCLILTQT
jgi:hypothetical protein